MTAERLGEEAKLAAADLEWLSGQARGRRILARLFLEGGLFHAVETSAELPHGEGGRALAARYQWLLLTRHPDRLASLLTENAERLQLLAGQRPHTSEGDSDG